MNARRLAKIVGPPLLYGMISAGCVVAAVAVGAAAVGTMIYVQGELKVQEAVSLDAAWEATLATLKELQLTLKEQSKDGLRARAHAEGADNHGYTIRLEKVNDAQTEIGIRVEPLPDRTQSEFILSKMRNHFPR